MNSSSRKIKAVAVCVSSLFACFCGYLLHSEVLALWETAAAVMHSLRITDRLAGVDIVLCAAPQGWWREMISVLFSIFLALYVYRNMGKIGVYTFILSGLSLMLCGALRCMQYIVVSKLVFNGASAPGHLWSADGMSTVFTVIYVMAIVREVRAIKIKSNPRRLAP
jgi:hypothetical protein